MQTISDKRQSAEKIVRNHTLWGALVSLIPIPLLDLGSVAMVQEDMLRDLCKLYNIPFNEKDIKNRIITVTGGSLPRVMASVIKRVPVVGLVIGEAALPVLVGASTYTMGNVVMLHFEEGGKTVEITPDAAKGFYVQLAERGKGILASYRKKVAKRKANKQTAEDIVWQ